MKTAVVYYSLEGNIQLVAEKYVEISLISFFDFFHNL